MMFLSCIFFTSIYLFNKKNLFYIFFIIFILYHLFINELSCYLVLNNWYFLVLRCDENNFDEMWITQNLFFIFTIEFVLFIEQSKFSNNRESLTKFSGLFGEEFLKLRTIDNLYLRDFHCKIERVLCKIFLEEKCVICVFFFEFLNNTNWKEKKLNPLNDLKNKFNNSIKLNSIK